MASSPDVETPEQTLASITKTHTTRTRLSGGPGGERVQTTSRQSTQRRGCRFDTLNCRRFAWLLSPSISSFRRSLFRFEIGFRTWVFNHFLGSNTDTLSTQMFIFLLFYVTTTRTADRASLPVFPGRHKRDLQSCQLSGVIRSVLGLVGLMSIYCDWMRKPSTCGSTSICLCRSAPQKRACCWNVKRATVKQLSLHTANSPATKPSTTSECRSTSNCLCRSAAGKHFACYWDVKQASKQTSNSCPSTPPAVQPLHQLQLVHSHRAHSHGSTHPASLHRTKRSALARPCHDKQRNKRSSNNYPTTPPTAQPLHQLQLQSALRPSTS